jgi:hypothetical protein
MPLTTFETSLSKRLPSRNGMMVGRDFLWLSCSVMAT